MTEIYLCRACSCHEVEDGTARTGFAYSWGPVVWCLCAEIFPTAQRAKGVSITTTTNWGFGLLISLFVPVLQDSLGFALCHPRDIGTSPGKPRTG
eukprot:COSAG01_NODE_744_length_13876_cov_4.660449_17_plen_95_part_00